MMSENDCEYQRFREAVINSLLANDIALPERTPLVKSKWKDAFGETSEVKKRKNIKEMSRRNFLPTASPTGAVLAHQHRFLQFGRDDLMSGLVARLSGPQTERRDTKRSATAIHWCLNHVYDDWPHF